MIPVNLGDQLQIAALLNTTTQTSSTNGAAVDLLGYEGEIAVILNAAKGTGNADNTLDVKIQDSADGSTSWGDVSGAAFTQVLGSGGTDSCQKISVNSNECKRYIRYVSTLAGTSPSYRYGVALLGMKQYADGA